MHKNRQAFTLIELLVVVLIIGILSAIALPQYRIAVAKTQYATVKHLAIAIKNAQEVYYMANNSYATKLDDLDVNLPASNDERNTNEKIYYTNGTCFITEAQSICNAKTTIGTLGYQIYYDHSIWPGLRLCVSFDKSLTSVSSRVCKSETGQSSPNGGGETFLTWEY